jgi:xanthine dehydrogenase accessory factor
LINGADEMQEIWNDIEQWQLAGLTSTLATVITVQGSSLRPAGSKMAVSSQGNISGSVTGGCVEGAVFEEAQVVRESGIPRLVSYGVSNESAWEVGLSCGGSIEVFIESMDTPAWYVIYPAIQECLNLKKSACLATIIAGPNTGKKKIMLEDNRVFGELGLTALDQAISSYAPNQTKPIDATTLTINTPQGEARIFLEYLLPPPRLIIVGAVHIAIPLVSMAKTMGLETVVIDARSAFATEDRFPHADQLIVEWPANALEKLGLDAASSVVCLSHDEKLDNPALQIALNSPAAYIGVLGSRKTHAKRREALLEMGVPETHINRIHAPIGLDLGALTPQEIALSIMAEIIAEQHAVSLDKK